MKQMTFTLTFDECPDDANGQQMADYFKERTGATRVTHYEESRHWRSDRELAAIRRRLSPGYGVAKNGEVMPSLYVRARNRELQRQRAGAQQ